MTSLLTERVELLRNHFVGNLNVVVVDGVLVVEGDGELGSEGDVEDESKYFLLLDVLRSLLFAGEGFAEHVDVVLLNIVEERVLEQLVHFFCLDLRAIHFLHQASGHLTRSEARHLRLASHFLERFVYFCFVVSLLDLEREFAAYVANFFKLDIHISFLVIVMILKYTVCGGEAPCAFCIVAYTKRRQK